jgi:hypothetical protein
MQQKSFVVVWPQHLFKKLMAGRSLRRNHAPLTHAGIHQKSQCKRQVTLLREVLDHLRSPVFHQREVVFRQIFDNLPFLVAHRGKDVHYFHARRKGRLLLVLCWEAGCRCRLLA